jgi:cysteine synthase A
MKQNTKICNNLLELIGQTPLLQLKRLFPNHNVIAKLEGFNPIGSIKDRVAFHTIDVGISQGLINLDTEIIESTSGNFGLGLAAACQFYGLKFIAVVDPKISPTNLKLLKLRKAQIEIVLKPDKTGNYLAARIERVRELCRKNPNHFWPCQYSSPENPNTHYYWTGRELLKQLEEIHLDYLMVAISTTGTICGLSRRLKEKYPNLKVIAVDEVGSSLFGGTSAPRYLNGMGAGQPLPELAVKTHEQGVVEQVIRVTLAEAVQGCHDLLGYEGVMAGGSGGAVIAALKKFLPTIPSRSSILIILADRGERYLDSFYDEEWVAQKLAQPQLTLAA